MNNRRLLMDLFSAAILGLCMAYAFTGSLAHEIIGMAFLLYLLVHSLRRRAYYSTAKRAIRRKKVTARFKIFYAVNLVMLYTTIIMLFSSILLSQELFAFANFSWVPISHSVLRIVHVCCTTMLLICILVHMCLHSRIYMESAKKQLKDMKNRSKIERVPVSAAREIN